MNGREFEVMRLLTTSAVADGRLLVARSSLECFLLRLVCVFRALLVLNCARMNPLG